MFAYAFGASIYQAAVPGELSEAETNQPPYIVSIFATAKSFDNTNLNVPEQSRLVGPKGGLADWAADTRSFNGLSMWKAETFWPR